MRDTMTIGVISGFCGTLVMDVYKLILLGIGFKFIAPWDTAAHIILNPTLCNTPLGYSIGFLLHFILGAIFGVMVAYTLRFSGKDYYLLKGLGVGAIVWLGSLGFFMRLLQIRLDGRNDAFTNLLTIFDWVIIGAVSSGIVARYARFKL
jgi:hypothetical protein